MHLPVADLNWLYEDSPETVFLCGAGLNRFLRDGNGVRPPLANDLLKVAFEWDAFHRPIGVMSGKEDLLDWLGKEFNLTLEEMRLANHQVATRYASLAGFLAAQGFLRPRAH